ncbi:MAG: hypothetical protein MJ246_02470 [Clostridia bacterium]|nr:hypothetical protein [Clostridia bacterium]
MIGFRDDRFYDYFNGQRGIVEVNEFDREECLKLFEDYKNADHQIY